MSEDDNDGEHDDSPRKGRRRKDGQPFKDGNVRDDGSYLVGKNRTPVSGRFAAGDGRRRGRRLKGVRNADTEFERELNRRMIIKENGVERTVSKSQAVDLRLLDNATRKGDNKAIEMVDQRRRRIAENHENNRRYHTLADQEILEAYLRERAADLAIDPKLFGDPEPPSTNPGDDPECAEPESGSNRDA